MQQTKKNPGSPSHRHDTQDPMTHGTEPTLALRSGINARLDRALQSFSAVWLPLLVGAFSLVAFLLWPAQYPPNSSQSLSFQAESSAESAWTPATAVERLGAAPAVSQWDTRLSEAPVWALIPIPPNPASALRTVEFPSRHATETRCWDAATLQPLGQASRSGNTGPMGQVRAGFALELPATASALLCQARFLGPARFTAQLWDPPELARHAQAFHRNSGLLDGGMLILAAFVLIAGLVNRDRHYLLFAAWLIINLRMAALSAGWDHQWLGQTIPFEWLVHLRPLTLALYYVVTFALFRDLFRSELDQIGHRTLLLIAQWTCLPLLALSITLPYSVFLPIIWISTGLGISILILLLTVILMRTKSRVAIWYTASISIALFASLYEVIAASLGFRGLIGAINSVTAALASSLLTSMAIAEQLRQEHKQRLEAQEELQHAYEVIPVGLFTLDQKGHFMSANPALQELLSSAHPATGPRRWQDHFGDDAWTVLWNQLRSGQPVEMELTTPGVAPQEAKHFWVKAALAGEKIEGSLQDITEKARSAEHLQFLANHDPLTKVLNRRGIESALHAGLKQIAQGRDLALAYLDLDRFKLINDLYGHNAGDEVLQQVCDRVKQPLTPGMHLGRVGGDEFLIVMTDTPLAQAETLCREIITSLGATPYQVGERAFQVRGSIGLIEIGPATTAKDAVSAADRACREAKRGQGMGLVVYERNSRVFTEHEAELQLIERLSSHQQIDGLFLEMQPIMSLRAPYASLNFEVLLRMQDEHGDRVPTERLIHAGEDAGRMGVIDRWVLSSTLDWLHRHAAELPQNQFVCMNLSGASLNDEKFMADVFTMLAAHSDITPRLCLEITESVALHDLGNTRRFIDMVRSHGAKVALDDFGAGYTSFSYLKDLPADLLKIDGSFIVNMNQHPANIAIVEAIVSLAQNLGMKTIAEWAEDAETVETLAEIGVDYVQGFVVARPQKPDLLLKAGSSAAFIADEKLSSYLNSLVDNDDELGHVDLILGTADKPV